MVVVPLAIDFSEDGGGLKVDHDNIKTHNTNLATLLNEVWCTNLCPGPSGGAMLCLGTGEGSFQYLELKSPADNKPKWLAEVRAGESFAVKEARFITNPIDGRTETHVLLLVADGVYIAKLDEQNSTSSLYNKTTPASKRLIDDFDGKLW